MGYDTGIADRLRSQGLNVVEVAGWQSRGSSSFSPRGFVWHHTAGPKTGNTPSLGVVTYGRAGLSGPLCNVYQARDNTCYVVAAGRANHAGEGSWRGLSGNSTVYGLEIENVGTQDEPWRLDQLFVAAKVAIALLGDNVDMMCHHKEWAPKRKIDMHTVTGEQMRDIARAILSNGGSSVPDPSVPPVDLAAIAAAIAVARTQVLHPGDSSDAVKWLQAGLNNTSGRGLVVNGIYDAPTESAVRDLKAFFGIQPVDSEVGPTVWAILFDLPHAAPPAPPAVDAGKAFQKAVAAEYGPRVSRITRTLKQGMRGDDVKNLQVLLNVIANAGLSIDGSFGPGTKQAVVNFQKFFNTPPADGIVGPKTRKGMVDVARAVAAG